MGELSGPTAADSSNNANSGTYFGNPNFGQPGAIANSSNTAVGLRGGGSGDYVEIPDSGNAAFSQVTSNAGLSVEVWMRPDLLVFPGQMRQPYIHWLGKGEQSQEEWGRRSIAKTRPTVPTASQLISGAPPGGEGAGAYFPNPDLAWGSGFTLSPATIQATGLPIRPPV